MNNLKIASYNIWFDNTMINERLVGLLAIIENNRLDIICLQEVRQDVYNILISYLKDHRYHYPNKIEYNYGCVVFSKYPIKNCSIKKFSKTNMGRGLVITKIEYPYHLEIDGGISVEKVELSVVTTHYESIFKNHNAVKLDQFDETKVILEDLYNDNKNVIFCADTNILPSEEKYFIKTSKKCIWQDAWETMGSDENKYTFDSNKNIYLKSKKMNYLSRLDRIIYRCDNAKLSHFQLLQAIGADIEPSDHYGIFVKFEIEYQKIEL